ncbi:DNA-binding transcriptional regulator, LysR family [Variovorax sp. OK605]|jgi:DNA-binding transcriptional LysR family regulator|uniref:LysR family transcriptional regulator n=1 Tax=unclassified Variovorax TaxID=663243 RepID=UPI0008C73FED|nr:MULTISPECIES: LysR family transcriptional regulator [unclassified Variovorax]SEK10412.1 DNA-binding transcriptional regulator, LysR family [Variovorax sp. OK202]SFD68186.1 DNA-binding transcriptional regulator, LysR family [Variovorax sp. OK212]SFQ10064.1 DNA-binding transcriptional regulator, LysR family [Variovorax sp. OK605]
MSQIDRVLRSNLKLRHLQLLVALDEFRHLGRVSEFLSITQPAVSKMLSEIERMFERQLFDRSTRGTVPTAYGNAAVRFARSVLADYQRTQDEIGAVASGGVGRTSVGAMVVATPSLLMPAIQRLKARSALTTVMVEEGDLTRLLPRLRVGELDLIVGRLEPGYASPDLDTEALYTEPMCIVVSPGHPIAGTAKPTWDMLAQQAWIVPPPWASSRSKLAQMFYKHRIDPPADIIETASFLVTLTGLQERPAVGFLARSVAQHLEKQGLVRILKIRIPIELPPVGIITLRGRQQTPAGLLLVACLRETAAAR